MAVISEPTAADVHAAAHAIMGALVRTPCLYSRTLSELTGAEIFVKFENLQYTASFKERGALNKLLALKAGGFAGGVAAMSAGNHAQGLAYHARRLGIPATIVMPKATPVVKVRHTRAFGARVVLEGDDLDGAKVACDQIVAAEGLTLVHPFDDPLIIAGQGTVALEMLDHHPDLEMLVVPLGGGGLISGMAIAAKAHNPAIEMIGVEAELFPSMREVLAGRSPHMDGLTIADGIAVKKPGLLTRTIIGRLVSDILLVSEAALERAIMSLLEIEKTVAEGAGAAALAAVLGHPERFRGRRVGIVLSGGNIDSRLLASVIQRSMARDGRVVRLRIDLKDVPGALAEVATVFGEAEANIIEVAHQRVFTRGSARGTQIEVVAETRDAGHARALGDLLRQKGYALAWLDGPIDEPR